MSSAVPPRRDRLIPWYFVGFFVVVFAVNAVFVTLAVRSHTGLVTDHPYEKGLAHNRAIEAGKQQDKLGWSARIAMEGDVLVVALRDAKGAAVQPSTMRARFSRPTRADLDFELPLTGGRTPVHFPMRGVWDVRVFATVGQQSYQQSQRLMIP